MMNRETLSTNLRRMALGIGLAVACLQTGCAPQQTAQERTASLDGHAYAEWMEMQPRTWIYGAAMINNPRNRGTLYIDFQRQQASGEGVFAIGGSAETKWKITGMHLITAHRDTTRPNETTAPKLLVFDGDFRVRNMIGEVFHSTTAYCDMSSTSQISINTTPPGVILRDGIDIEGLVTTGGMLFH